MTHRVVVADRLAEAGLKLLAATPELEVANVAGRPREELERALAGAHALVVRSETRVTADLLTRAPNLRVIARAGTGVDNIDVHAATRRGIAVMNAPGASRVTADLLTRAPNLRVIARAGTGVDNIDVHAATRRGIAVMNAPGANTVSAAE